jgi:biotin operon repressor
LGKFIDWSSVDLETRLITESYTDISHTLGVSIGAVAKRAKKLGLGSRHTNKKQVKRCPVCGKEMGHRSITCSVECSGIKQRKTDWDTIDLAELLKTKSYLAIADELGVSDAAVHKRAKKLGLK